MDTAARAKRILGRAYLSAIGWEKVGERPEPAAYVLIAAPHTTNWDLPHMLAISFAFDIPIRWAGKHTLFKPPFGWFMRGLGGLAIKRDKRHNRVQQLAALFEEYPNLVLAVPAEGTRSRTEHWKSGFYHIAREANVPIVCSFLDYGTKSGGLGPTIHPTGDIKRDMDQIRAFYADKTGKFPDQFGPVRLRNEGDSVASDAA